MKATMLFFAPFFLFANLAIAQTKIGQSMMGVSHDIRNGTFGSVEYQGYNAEIIHIEFLPETFSMGSGWAQVFMSYAVYDVGMDSFSISIDEANGGSILRTGQLIQKTGITSFFVKQKEKNELIFSIEVSAKLPWLMSSEPFNFSTVKQEAVATPINSASAQTSFTFPLNADRPSDYSNPATLSLDGSTCMGASLWGKYSVTIDKNTVEVWAGKNTVVSVEGVKNLNPETDEEGTFFSVPTGQKFSVLFVFTRKTGLFGWRKKIYTQKFFIE